MKVLNCLSDKYQLFIKQNKVIAIMHARTHKLLKKMKLLIKEKEKASILLKLFTTYICTCGIVL